VPVTVAPVLPQAIQRTLSATGTLAGYDEVMLTPKVDGRVRAVYVDSGDTVFPGQVLLETDATDYVLAVNDARRALEAELATIDLTEIPKGAFDVEAVPLVRRAEASRLNALRQYERIKNLTTPSRAELDQSETEMKVAEANKRDAVTVAKARLASARWRQAALETAEQRLRDCELRAPDPTEANAWAAVLGVSAAPIRYTVAQRLTSVGDMIRSMPVTNVFKMVVTQCLKLRATLPERYIADVALNQTVAVTVEAYPNQSFRGRVARIHPTVDQNNRTFQVEIQIPNLDNRLRVGSFARATIQIRKDPNVLTVPPQAVLTFAGISKVFVIQDGLAKAIPVEIGTRETDWIEVIGAIPANSKVATSGFSQLVDGSKVRVRE
jgi:multidrug efflux pump subunit AcrA (membrane-fusion protein)